MAARRTRDLWVIDPAELTDDQLDQQIGSLVAEIDRLANEVATLARVSGSMGADRSVLQQQLNAARQERRARDNGNP